MQAEYGCYLYDQACRPLLTEFMTGPSLLAQPFVATQHGFICFTFHDLVCIAARAPPALARCFLSLVLDRVSFKDPSFKEGKKTPE